MNTVRQLHAATLRDAGVIIENLAGQEWDRPSRCAEWSLRDLVRHMVGQNFGFAAAISGGDAAVESYAARAVDEWGASIDALLRAIATPAPSIRLVEVRPNDRFPLAAVLGMHMLDTAVHIWDIKGPPWHPSERVIELILMQARRIPVARREGGPFGSIVTSLDPDPWHEALHLLGRSVDPT